MRRHTPLATALAVGLTCATACGPEAVQPAATVVMGKGSGIDSIHMWLQRIGMQVSEEDALKITAAVKAHSLKSKKLLTEAEFRDLAKGVVKSAAA